MTLDLGLANGRKRGRPPIRLLVFVDDHRPDPLIKVMPSHHAGNYPVFGAHALVESERLAAPLQRECELEVSGDLALIVAASVRARSPSLPSPAALISRLARISSTRFALNQRSIAGRWRVRAPASATSVNAASTASTGTAPQRVLDELSEPRRSYAMGRNATAKPGSGVEEIARESAIRAKLARQAWQNPRRTDVGKEADPNLGHGKPEGVACHPVRAVDGYPGATAITTPSMSAT